MSKAKVNKELTIDLHVKAASVRFETLAGNKIHETIANGFRVILNLFARE